MLRQLSHRSLLMAVAAVAGLVGEARAQSDVLFVGNSFTHGHLDPVLSYNSANITDENGTNMGGVPGIFKQFTLQAGLSYNVSIEAVSGQTLAYHYANKSAIIGQAKWETVVFQENSTVPLPSNRGGTPSTFFTAAGNLKQLMTNTNPSASLLLYETWASPTSVTNQSYSPGTTGLHQMTDDLQKAYYKAFYDYGFSGVARVGDAFMAAVDQGKADANPADGISPGMFNIWSADDTRHASKHGSYLSAAVMYAKITHADPRQLSGSAANSAAFQLGISAADATTLHTLAYEINNLADPDRIITTRNRVTSAGFSGAATAAHPSSVTGNASINSLTTSEGTFTNLVGATANNIISTQASNSVGTAPATKEISASGLTVNDGVNNLTSGNWQFSGIPMDATARFFIVESALTSGAIGDDATVTLINSSNAVVGSFSLSLLAGDFTDSPANNTAAALATLTYNAGTLAGQPSKLGGVTFSLADFGVTDYSLISSVTGIRIQSSTLDPSVVGAFTVVPEPASLSMIALAAGLLRRRRR